MTYPTAYRTAAARQQARSSVQRSVPVPSAEVRAANLLDAAIAQAQQAMDRNVPRPFKLGENKPDVLPGRRGDFPRPYSYTGRTRIPGSLAPATTSASKTMLRGIRAGLRNHPLMNAASVMQQVAAVLEPRAARYFPGFRPGAACGPPGILLGPYLPSYGLWRAGGGGGACINCCQAYQPGNLDSIRPIDSPYRSIEYAVAGTGFGVVWLNGPLNPSGRYAQVEKWLPDLSYTAAQRAQAVPGVKLMPVMKGQPNSTVDPLAGHHPIGAWENNPKPLPIALANGRVWNPDRVEQTETGPQRRGRAPENQQAYERQFDRPTRPETNLVPKVEPWPQPILVDGHDKFPWPRQRKIGFRWRAAYQLAGMATEGLDAIDCMFDALPKRVRAPIIRAHRKYGRPVSMKAKLKALASNMGQMDMERFGKCMMIEGLMDSFYAAGGKAGVETSRAGGSARPSGLQQTQQGEGTDYGSENPIKAALEWLYDAPSVFRKPPWRE